MGAFQEGLKAQLPMTLARYMALCNQNYYDRRDPIGTDFITAPEISQIFGECIGALMTHLWNEMGRPEVDIIEGGPGRGTLMRDMMRTIKIDTYQLYMIETSSHLKSLQKNLLKDYRPIWLNNISEITLNKNYKLMILNELFDALPVHQHVFKDKAWQEVMVCADSDALYGLGHYLTPCSAPVKTHHAMREPQEGDVYEDAPARVAMMAEICKLLARSGGAAVIIDYGPARWDYGDSIQAVSRHKFVPVLSDPGAVDLTSHVDFDALAAYATNAGLYVHPLMTQAYFLDRLGGRLRAAALNQQEAYARLTDPDKMGALFKVLIVAHPAQSGFVGEVFNG